MKHALLPVLLAGAATLTGGCASTARPASASDRLTPREVFGDLARQEFGKQLQVRLPAKVAVTDVSGDRYDRVAAQRLVQATNGLAEDTDTYTDVVSVPIEREDWRDYALELEPIRTRAAAHQADLQVLIARREEVHESTSPLGILNILIIPAFFLPTQHDEVTLTVRAMVRDVRNGLIYTTFDHHHEESVTTTLAGESSTLRETRTTLYDDAIRALRESLARKLPALERSARERANP